MPDRTKFGHYSAARPKPSAGNSAENLSVALDNRAFSRLQAQVLLANTGVEKLGRVESAAVIENADDRKESFFWVTFKTTIGIQSEICDKKPAPNISGR
jgi:hypothetical protein